MKSENVKIGNFVNMAIWARSMKNPPRFVKITAIKDDDGTVTAELFGKEYVDVKAAIEKQKKAGEEKKEKKEEKKADEKKEEKEETKTAAPEKKEEEPKKEDKKAAPKKETKVKKE